MAISGVPGPLVVYGQNPAVGSTSYQPDYNGDQAPSAFAFGSLLLDTRYGFRPPIQSGTLAALGFYEGADLMLVDETPAAAAGAAIAALANVTSGTAMTLVSASGSGIVVSTSSFYAPWSGLTIPAGALYINSQIALIYFGQNKSVSCLDPRTSVARAVSITGTASGTGGAFIVRGYDVFGYQMSETITCGAGVNTVNGKRAFKVISSVTPQFTDAHNYSVGTTDIIGFPMMATNFAQAYMVWNGGVITSSTGFVAGVTTTMTQTNGDVRGTYTLQSSSDGTKTLQIYLSPAPWNANATNGTASLFGQTQFFA